MPVIGFFFLFYTVFSFSLLDYIVNFLSSCSVRSSLSISTKDMAATSLVDF